MNAIDTHVHVWDLERLEYRWLKGNTTILNRSYAISELTPQIQEAGVTGGVLVQAANTEEETEHMLEVAGATPWILGVVGWLPLHDPARVATILEEGYALNPLFKGVRHLIHDEQDPQWLLRDSQLESLQLLARKNLPYDVVGVNNDHLKTVIKLGEKLPRLRMVLDHLNQPPIAKGEKYGEWGRLIKEVASNSMVSAKISGLGTTTGKGHSWSEEDIKPYLSFALETFGSQRCFCGGDWPVSLLAGSYGHAWQVYGNTITNLLGDEEALGVLEGNARNFYGLDDR